MSPRPSEISNESQVVESSNRPSKAPLRRPRPKTASFASYTGGQNPPSRRPRKPHGGPFQSQASMHCVSNWYRSIAPVERADHVIVAVNPMLAMAAGSEWPGTRIRVGKGPDGADRALINELQDPRWVASHYDRVVIGSGDGIFASIIASMRGYGIAVGVLARERHVSRALKRSADFVMLFRNVDDAECVA